MHIPVLNKEVLELLDPRPDENFIDGTGGAGGHTLAILEKNQPAGKILFIDWDSETLQRTEKNITAQHPSLAKRIIFVNRNYADLSEIVKEKNFGPVNGILLDLGFSSDQLETSGRGFSFLKDEELDMRYSLERPVSAKEIVNQWPKERLAEIFEEYGEERWACRIVRAIVVARQRKPILKTRELVNIIALAVPQKFQHGRTHFATRVFQALRLAVNNELGNLRKFLPQAVDVLSKDGRLAIISFHSLEDRVVKNFFREQSQAGRIRILNKKPIVPLLDEINSNPRSRSAKLRAAVKI